MAALWRRDSLIVLASVLTNDCPCLGSGDFAKHGSTRSAHPRCIPGPFVRVLGWRSTPSTSHPIFGCLE